MRETASINAFDFKEETLIHFSCKFFSFILGNSFIAFQFSFSLKISLWFWQSSEIYIVTKNVYRNKSININFSSSPSFFLRLMEDLNLSCTSPEISVLCQLRHLSLIFLALSDQSIGSLPQFLLSLRGLNSMLHDLNMSILVLLFYVFCTFFSVYCHDINF